MKYPEKTTLADYQPLMDNLKELGSTPDLSIAAFGEEWAGRTARTAYNEIETLEQFLCENGLATKYITWKEAQGKT